MARTFDAAEGLARLTLDRDLRVTPASEPQFVASDSTASFRDDRLILELKYRAHLPAIFRRLVEEFSLQPQSASKYRLGMAALGHTPTPAPGAMLSGTDASYA